MIVFGNSPSQLPSTLTWVSTMFSFCLACLLFVCENSGGGSKSHREVTIYMTLSRTNYRLEHAFTDKKNIKHPDKVVKIKWNCMCWRFIWLYYNDYSIKAAIWRSSYSCSVPSCYRVSTSDRFESTSELITHMFYVGINLDLAVMSAGHHSKLLHLRCGVNGSLHMERWTCGPADVRKWCRVTWDAVNSWIHVSGWQVEMSQSSVVLDVQSSLQSCATWGLVYQWCIHTKRLHVPGDGQVGMYQNEGFVKVYVIIRTFYLLW